MVSEKPKVTAVLLNWKRPQNFARIIPELLKWPFIDEVIIHDNSKGENLMCQGRYHSAARAQNGIIYTQDDDAIIRNLDEVYEAFIADPTRVCHSGTAEYQKVIPDNIYGESQMAMLGWGGFFKKEWMPVLTEYIKVYGKDDCLKRETDRIFTMLRKQHHNFVLGDIEHLDDRGPEAMSSQPDHLKFKQLAIERALKINGI